MSQMYVVRRLRLLTCVVIGLLLTLDAQAQLFDATAIVDMPQPDGSCLTYKSFQGGLYENCSNSVPLDHDADGQLLAGQIQRLDLNGNPSSTGKIVFLSMGMSNAQQEFGTFLTSATKNVSVNNAALALSNSAASNMVACLWYPAYGPPSCNPTVQNQYDRIAATMATRGIGAAQVQVAWIKNANGRTHTSSRGCSPLGTLCVPLCDPTTPGCSNMANSTDALNVEQELGNALRAAKQRWPHLTLAFVTSRIYGGYAPSSGGSPEPYAYESGYAVKWLMEAQINQMRTGIIDPVAGDLNYNNGTAPWIAWGPYLWADGPVARSDGLVWCDGTLSLGPPCNGEVDFALDGEHPTTTTKQVNMLMNFFLNSPYSTPWFLKH